MVPPFFMIGIDAWRGRHADGTAALGQHRPIEQREEHDLVALDIDADGLARLDRGALA